MTPARLRRTFTATATALVAGGLAVSSTVSPVHAVTIGGVDPVRSIAVGTDLPLQAIANDGTSYSALNSDIDVWAADSDGQPDIVKTFTGANVEGQPQLDEVRGLAYATGASVVVMDPHQAGGAVVPTRTISGALTQLDNPAATAWTPNGSLWVEDPTSADGPELLRFAPGADGDVAPVQRIAGDRAKLLDNAVIGSTSFIAGMPDNGVAAAIATIGNPTVLIFGGSQHGNVAPAHRVVVPTPSPHWLSEGLASDAAGRLYIGSGDINGDYFGRLDVYSRTGKSLVTLGGTAERFQIPLVPTVAANGTLALDDALIVALGGSPTTAARVEVYKPLFAKPGAVGSLKVKTSVSAQTVTWRSPSNPGGTPPSYKVVVKKGSRTVFSKKVGGTKLAIARKALPKGSLKVTVTAVNVGGSGRGVSKTISN